MRCFLSHSEMTNTNVCFTLQFSLTLHFLINIRTAVHVVLLSAPSVWPVRRPDLYSMTVCNCIFSPYKFFSRFLVRDISSRIQSSSCYVFKFRDMHILLLSLQILWLLTMKQTTFFWASSEMVSLNTQPASEVQ